MFYTDLYIYTNQTIHLQTAYVNTRTILNKNYILCDNILFWKLTKFIPKFV
jgi:hypothetical protein